MSITMYITLQLKYHISIMKTKGLNCTHIIYLILGQCEGSNKELKQIVGGRDIWLSDCLIKRQSYIIKWLRKNQNLKKKD